MSLGLVPKRGAIPEWRAAIQLRASTLWKAGRRAEALAEIEAALTVRPRDRRLILRQCSFLTSLDRPREAIPTLEALRREHPADVDIGLGLAQAYHAAGEHDAALALLEALLLADPLQRGAWVARIETLLAANRAEAALAATVSALAHLPEDRWLLQKRGSLLRGLGRAAEAADVLTLLHRRWPEDIGIARDLAEALGAAGDHAGSMAALDAVLALNPADQRAWQAKLDAAAARADQPALAALAGQLFGRLSAGGDEGAAMLLAQVIPQLDLTRWGAEAVEWISAVCPHGARIRPPNLWTLHGIAELLGEPQICRQLLACLLAKPRLPLPVALSVLRWARATSEEHYQHLEPRLRARLPEGALRLFELERMALLQGPAEALRRRPRAGARDLREVALLVSLMQKAKLTSLSLRYVARVRRVHPADPELRRLHLVLLDAAGECERARQEAEAMLAPSATPCVKDQRAALDILISLGHVARALEVLESVENESNRRAFRKLRLELMLRFGRVNEVRTLISETMTLSHARRSVHFGLTLEGQQFIELRLVEASQASSLPAPEEGQLTSASIRTLDLLLERRPRPPREGPGRIPRRIMQYWSTGQPPPAVQEIMASWRKARGFDHQLFDRQAARRFLVEQFGAEWGAALSLAKHAAEESDFFRLAFLAARGGIYADCDDMLIGQAEGLTKGARGLVVYRERRGSIANNLLLAEPAHPVLIRAAVAAKQALLRKDNDSTWTKTGPGLLTRMVANALQEAARTGTDAGIMVRRLQEEAPHVRCHIPLPYKKTARYWNASKSGGHLATTPAPLP